jgi:hypothetical protein
MGGRQQPTISHSSNAACYALTTNFRSNRLTRQINYLGNIYAVPQTGALTGLRYAPPNAPLRCRGAGRKRAPLGPLTPGRMAMPGATSSE